MRPVALTLWLLAPAPPGTAPVEAAPVTEAPAAADYTAADAARDADLLLTGQGLEYTAARSRLVQHGALAAPALVDRMNVVPPPNPAERKRLLDVLARLRRPEDLAVFAAELRRAIERAAPGKEEAAAAPWREILKLQGPAAMPAYLELVGNRDLDVELRGTLLGDVVEIAPASAVPDLVALVGVGDRRLQRPLRQALATRARSDATVIAAVDAALASGEPARRAALLLTRAELPDDAAFVKGLGSIATDEAQPFTARVAAIRIMSATQDPAHHDTLASVAGTELANDRRGGQASEILGRLAVDGLPPERAAQVVGPLQLAASRAPRLAALGYRHGTALPDSWFEDSQQNVWPQVRQAGLERVAPPCDAPRVKQLAAVARSPTRGGDPDGAVARAAAVALGRCESPEAMAALRRLLDDAEASADRRAVAARQLVRHGGADGAARVVKALEGVPERDLGRKLASALGYAPAPTPEIKRGLCAALEQAPDVARAAKDTLQKLFPAATSCP